MILSKIDQLLFFFLIECTLFGMGVFYGMYVVCIESQENVSIIYDECKLWQGLDKGNENMLLLSVYSQEVQIYLFWQSK